MAKAKQISEMTQKVIDFLKSNDGVALSWKDIAEGVPGAKTGHLTAAMKQIPVMVSEAGSTYVYNEAEYTPAKDSKPSEESKAVAAVFKANPGAEFTLAELSEKVGFKVLSGHISGARAILGKDNVVRIEYARTYTYVSDCEPDADVDAE